MSQYTDDLHSLSRTKWNGKYHVVFAPKYRRKDVEMMHSWSNKDPF